MAFVKAKAATLTVEPKSGREAATGRRADPDAALPALSAVDRDSPTELYRQVAAEIRRAIADGEAKPGQRIPQAKDLAAVMGVNTNTVLRAVRLLRDEGILSVGRGRGIRVTGTPQRTQVITKLKEALELGQSYGYKREQLAAMLNTLP